MPPLPYGLGSLRWWEPIVNSTVPFVPILPPPCACQPIFAWRPRSCMDRAVASYHCTFGLFANWRGYSGRRPSKLTTAKILSWRPHLLAVSATDDVVFTHPPGKSLHVLEIVHPRPTCALLCVCLCCCENPRFLESPVGRSHTACHWSGPCCPCSLLWPLRTRTA